MMKVRIGVIEPGAIKPYKKWDYTFPAKLPALPRIGETIVVTATDMNGKIKMSKNGIDFFKHDRLLVEDITWNIHLPDDGEVMHEVGTAPVGKMDEVVIWVSDITG